MMPLTTPMPTTKTAPRASAAPSGNCVRDCAIAHATATTMVATIARPMPRPITTNAIPSPRMPRIDTLRTSDKRFSTARKPGRNSAKPQNINAASRKTISSCVGRQRNIVSSLLAEESGRCLDFSAPASAVAKHEL